MESLLALWAAGGERAATIQALPEEHWTHDQDETDAIRAWAKVNDVPDDGVYRKDAVTPRRSLAFRIRPRPRALLRDGSKVRPVCLVTNRSDPLGGTGLDRICWQRGTCGTIEPAHDVRLNALAGAALPSPTFGANAAWLRLNVLLYTLLSAFQRVGLPEEWHTARPKRRRFLVRNTVGTVVRHARDTLLRCTKARARTLADRPHTAFVLTRPSSSPAPP